MAARKPVLKPRAAPSPATFGAVAPERTEAHAFVLDAITYDETVNVRKLAIIERAVAARKVLESLLVKMHATSGKRPTTQQIAALVPQVDASLMADLGDLLGSIPEVGVIEPPVACIEGKRTVLHAGYRRFAALWLLYGSTHEQLFHLVKLSPAQRKAANLAENVARRSVSAWAAAARCYELKFPKDNEKPWSTDQIAKSCGYSVSHVENLIRVEKKLHPKIRTHWQKWGDSVPLERLIKVVAKEKSEQPAYWEQLNGTAKRPPRAPKESTPAPEPQTEPQSAETETPPGQPLTVAELARLLRNLDGVIPGPDWKDGHAWLAGATHALRVSAGMEYPFKLPGEEPETPAQVDELLEDPS